MDLEMCFLWCISWHFNSMYRDIISTCSRENRHINFFHTTQRKLALNSGDCIPVSIRKICKTSAFETRGGRRLHICTASLLTEDSVLYGTSWQDNTEIERSMRAEVATVTQIVNNRYSWKDWWRQYNVERGGANRIHIHRGGRHM